MTQPSRFDPFDPAFFVDPYPAYRTLRHEHPVFRCDIEEPQVFPHYWMLSRAQDVDGALQDWRTYSSAAGTLIDTDISLKTTPASRLLQRLLHPRPI